jgi:hypothetical protein
MDVRTGIQYLLKRLFVNHRSCLSRIIPDVVLLNYALLGHNQFTDGIDNLPVIEPPGQIEKSLL